MMTIPSIDLSLETVAPGVASADLAEVEIGLALPASVIQAASEGVDRSRHEETTPAATNLPQGLGSALSTALTDNAHLQVALESIVSHFEPVVAAIAEEEVARVGVTTGLVEKEEIAAVPQPSDEAARTVEVPEVGVTRPDASPTVEVARTVEVPEVGMMRPDASPTVEVSRTVEVPEVGVTRPDASPTVEVARTVEVPEVGMTRPDASPTVEVVRTVEVPEVGVTRPDDPSTTEERANVVLSADVVQLMPGVRADAPATPEKVSAVTATEVVRAAYAPDAVFAASAVTPESAVLVEAANAVADQLLVTPGLMRGQGEVVVQLKPDVLDGTEVRIAVTGRELAVTFQPVTTETAVLIERCQGQLAAHLSAKIATFNVSVDVRKKRS